MTCHVAVFWLTRQREEVRCGTAGPRVIELCDVFGINFVVVVVVVVVVVLRTACSKKTRPSPSLSYVKVLAPACLLLHFLLPGLRSQRPWRTDALSGQWWRMRAVKLPCSNALTTRSAGT